MTYIDDGAVIASSSSHESASYQNQFDIINRQGQQNPIEEICARNCFLHLSRWPVNIHPLSFDSLKVEGFDSHINTRVSNITSVKESKCRECTVGGR